MSLSIVAANFGATSTFSAGPISVPLTGAAIGDLMIVNFATNSTYTPGSYTINAPGWTVTQSIAPTLSYRCTFTLTKVCTAADLGGSVSITAPAHATMGLAMIAVRSSTAGNRAVVSRIANNSDVAGTYVSPADLVVSFQGETAATAPTTPISDSPYGHSFTSYARQSTAGAYAGSIFQQVGYFVPSPRTATTGYGFGTSSGGSMLWDAGVWLVEQVGTPAAPAIVSPAPGSVIDAALGVPITATYTPTNGATMSSYALRYFDGTTNYYWTGSAWTTTLTYVTLSVAPGANFTVTPTIGATHGPANGSSGVYGVSTKESAGGNASAFSTVSLTFDATPVVTTSAPSGTQATPTPLVSWSTTYSGSSSQAAAQVIVYTAAQAAIGGFTPGLSPSTWDSGMLPGSTASMTVGTQLPAGSYVAYVAVTDTLGLVATFDASPSFTVVVDTPAAPVVGTPTAAFDGFTGLPGITVPITPAVNLLALTDSNFDAGIGAWLAVTSSTLGTSATHALEGNALTVTPAGAAAQTIYSGAGPLPGGGPSAGIAVPPLTAQASFYGAGFTGTVNIAVALCNASGTVVATLASSSHTITSSGWTTISKSYAAIAPTVYPSAVSVRLVVTFTSTAAGLAFYLDDPAIMTTVALGQWAPGGFGGFGTDYLELQRSLDSGGTWTAAGTVTSMYGATAAVDTTTPPNTPAVYRARLVSQVNGAGPFIAGPWSATTSSASTTANGQWWLQDPTNGTAIGFVLAADPSIAPKELGTISYPLGRALPVKVTDGWKGRTGTLPIALSSLGNGVSGLADLEAIVIGGSGTLLLWSPGGDSIKCVHDPATDLAVSYTHTTLETDVPFSSVAFAFIEVA